MHAQIFLPENHILSIIRRMFSIRFLYCISCVLSVFVKIHVQSGAVCWTKARIKGIPSRSNRPLQAYSTSLAASSTPE